MKQRRYRVAKFRESLQKKKKARQENELSQGLFDIGLAQKKTEPELQELDFDCLAEPRKVILAREKGIDPYAALLDGLL